MKMKVKHFLRSVISFAFLALLLLPIAAGAAGVTPAELDTMAVDPQSWKLQRDMTWHDYKPNPVIDWMADLNEASLSNKFAHALNPNQNRPIIGGLILIEYLDRKFISKGEVSSDVLGYYLYDRDGGGMNDGISNNPILDVPQLIAEARGITREAALADPNFNDWFAQWWADYLNKPQTINDFVGVDQFWRENSYGKWATDLRPFGPFTIPFFEFETMGRDMDPGNQKQSWDDVPPSFRNPTIAPAGLEVGDAFEFDPIAHDMAIKGEVPFDDFDFFFLLHAGYDESGVWQEFGQAQFATRKDIPYELGPGPRMLKVEAFFTDDVKNNNAETLKLYIQRYANEPLFKTRLAEYEELATKVTVIEELAESLNPVPEAIAAELEAARKAAAEWEFKLSTEDWEWVDGYNDLTSKNTRYVDFTCWEAAVGDWSHAGSYTHNGRRIPRSTQGENDGMGTFAHEFGHISSISDNYGNPWNAAASPATEPWELMSRGSFMGPFGDHARWAVPGIEASSVPTHLMEYNKNEKLSFYDDGDLLELSVEELAGQTPVVADIVARNIPLADDVLYPGLKTFGLNQGDYYKGIKLNFGINEFKVANTLRTDPSADITVDNEWKDKAALVTAGFTNMLKPADSMTVEVVDQSGYDSFNHDHGVLITRANLRNPTLTGNNPGNVSNPSHAIIDSHLYDIAMLDYLIGAENIPAPYPLGHATQLADAAFHAGVSFTDTGYYATGYGSREGNNPAEWAVAQNGSIVKGEPRGERDIVAGETVNEFYDEANGLHFYILRKNLTDGRTVNGETQKFMSYQIGMRHDEGEAVEGSLRLTQISREPASPGNYSRHTYELVNSGAESADIVRITLSGSWAQGLTQDIQVITGRNETKTVTVPKPFSEQNAVILNNLYAIEPGETVSFDVFVRENMTTEVKEVFVTASSESNADNVTTYGRPTAPTEVVAALAANDSRNVTVSFTPPVGYDVDYYNLISDFVVVASRDSSPFTVTDLTVGSEYRFAVSAVNEHGESPSALSNPVTPTTLTGDNADIAAAKLAVESAVYGPVSQADVSTSAAAKAVVQNVINGLSLSGVTAVIVDAGFAPAVAGTAANTNGTDGFYVFNATLSKGTGTTVMTNPKTLNITATPYVVPPIGDRGTINGAQVNLDADAEGTGWTWTAASKTLTLTGGNVGAAALDVEGDTTVHVAENASSSGIVKTGTGSLTVSGAAANTLTVHASAGAAILAEGDVVIESGNLIATTNLVTAAAIESITGSVSVTGDANVTAEANRGSAFKGARDVSIGTSGTVNADTAGVGYALEAGNAIAITNGTVELNVEDEAHAYSVEPTISDTAHVTINTTSTGSGGGGGCNAGYALLALAALVPFVIRKRK